jgi:hypothetical protein
MTNLLLYQRIAQQLAEDIRRGIGYGLMMAIRRGSRVAGRMSRA